MCAYWGNGAKMINIRLLALQMCSSQRSSSLTHSLRGAGVELVNGVKPDGPQHRIISRSDTHTCSMPAIFPPLTVRVRRWHSGVCFACVGGPLGVDDALESLAIGAGHLW